MSKSIIDDLEFIRRRQKELYPNRPYETSKEASRIAGDTPKFKMEYQPGISGEFAGKRIDAHGVVTDASYAKPEPPQTATAIPAQAIQSGPVSVGVCHGCKGGGWVQASIGLIECKVCGNPQDLPCP